LVVLVLSVFVYTYVHFEEPDLGVDLFCLESLEALLLLLIVRAVLFKFLT